MCCSDKHHIRPLTLSLFLSLGQLFGSIAFYESSCKNQISNFTLHGCPVDPGCVQLSSDACISDFLPFCMVCAWRLVTIQRETITLSNALTHVIINLHQPIVSIIILNAYLIRTIILKIKVKTRPPIPEESIDGAWSRQTGD